MPHSLCLLGRQRIFVSVAGKCARIVFLELTLFRHPQVKAAAKARNSCCLFVFIKGSVRGMLATHSFKNERSGWRE